MNEKSEKMGEKEEIEREVVEGGNYNIVQENLKNIELSKKDMGRGYRTYAEAVRNCRRDEITIYNPIDGLYYNVKILPRTKKDFWRIGSEW